MCLWHSHSICRELPLAALCIMYPHAEKCIGTQKLTTEEEFLPQEGVNDLCGSGFEFKVSLNPSESSQAGAASATPVRSISE